jgi:hypothetical protein
MYLLLQVVAVAVLVLVVEVVVADLRINLEEQ